MAILVTGGTGYIGSHTCVELLNAGYEIVVLDNLSNSRPEAARRIEELTAKSFSFINGDILDWEKLEEVFKNKKIEAVMHFAALKAVGESVKNPLKYYMNNVAGSITLFEVMKKYAVKKLIFSSSANVYGMQNQSPLTEDLPLSTTNPYGNTKLVVEHILRDLAFSDSGWSISILRYFNAIGAHKSGRLGENPQGVPDNLLPYLTQVAAGIREKLYIFGNDYETPDGTCIRDYVHVTDISKGHLKALEKVMDSEGLKIHNLGTGKGYSVLEVIRIFEEVTGRHIPYEFIDKRVGDAAICYADVHKAEKELGWRAEKSLEDMLRDAWQWQENIADVCK